MKPYPGFVDATIDPAWTERLLAALSQGKVHVIEEPSPAERGKITVVIGITPAYERWVMDRADSDPEAAVNGDGWTAP